MNRNSKRLGAYIVIALVILAAAAGLKCAACLRDLDYKYGYFDSKGLINAANILIASGFGVMLSYAVVGCKCSLKPSFSSPATYVPTGIVGAAELFLSVRTLSSVRDLTAAGTRLPAVIATLAGLLGLLSIVHFFLNAALTESKTELRAYFALATVLFLSVYSAVLYFSTDEAINTPIKLSSQMAFLFSSLFFLYEARISLGRELWRGYAVFGLFAMLLCAYASIPNLIVYFVRGVTLSLNIEESLLLLSLFIFIASRLILTASLPEDKENRTLTALRERAELSERSAREIERQYDEAYAVQMTIDDMIPAEDMPMAHEELADEFELPLEDLPETVFVTEDFDEDDGQIELIPDVFDVAMAELHGEREDISENTEFAEQTELFGEDGEGDVV